MANPTRVFKYESLTTQTLRNLKGQVLFFGSPRNFNDPYDCALHPFIKPMSDDEVEKVRSHHLADVEIPEAVRRGFQTETTQALRELLMRTSNSAISAARDDFLKTKGVTCFSEVNDDLLMWSHYGGRYKGLCLEFDTSIKPFDLIKRVNYLSKLPEVDVWSILVSHTFEPVSELFCAKSIAWSYEREWRAFHNEAGTRYVYPSEALRGVYFGPDIEQEALEIVCLLLSGQNDQVKFYRGARSATEFKVVFTPFT